MGDRKKKIEVAVTEYQCRHCAHSYDWHSLSLKGEPILCRCPHQQQGGKYCIFLSDPTCEHFELRKDNEQKEANKI